MLISEYKKLPLEEYATNAKTTKYKAGSIILRQGDVNNYCVNIIEGDVRIDILDAKGRVKLINILNAGLIGLSGIITGGTVSGNVYAITDTVVHKIYRLEFLDLINKNEVFRTYAFINMEKIIDIYINKSIREAYNSTFEILTLVLLKYVEEFGVEQTDGSIMIDIELTDETLGEIVGVSRETITKNLMRYKKDNTISKKKKKIYIHDIEKLNEIIKH